MGDISKKISEPDQKLSVRTLKMSAKINRRGDSEFVNVVNFQTKLFSKWIVKNNTKIAESEVYYMSIFWQVDAASTIYFASKIKISIHIIKQLYNVNLSIHFFILISTF